jgi:hypothetical protein
MIIVISGIQHSISSTTNAERRRTILFSWLQERGGHVLEERRGRTTAIASTMMKAMLALVLITFIGD